MREFILYACLLLPVINRLHCSDFNIRLKTDNHIHLILLFKKLHQFFSKQLVFKIILE